MIVYVIVHNAMDSDAECLAVYYDPQEARDALNKMANDIPVNGFHFSRDMGYYIDQENTTIQRKEISGKIHPLRKLRRIIRWKIKDIRYFFRLDK